MVMLFCAIVGKERNVPIEIEDDKSVGILKEAIAKKTNYCLDAPDLLTLYMAKENGNVQGAWMRKAHPHYAPLLSGDKAVEAIYLTTDMIDAAGSIVTVGTLLDETESIEDYFADAPKKGVIHVLVQLPKDEEMEIENFPFDPSSYEVTYPLLEARNGEMYLTLLGRDEVVQKINNIVLYAPSNEAISSPKYSPIVISTSRGMGKTFLLKMIGMQKVKEHLKCPKIQQAGSCGRIISFDFSKHEYDIQTVEDIESFFTRLMVYYLCRLFENKRVDGMNFYYTAFKQVKLEHPDQKFNKWRRTCISYDADRMMDEYIRLTNIAFYGEQEAQYCAVPPVFLLDEVQLLCVDIGIESKMLSRKHTVLSYLLTQLSGTHWPICICAGTNNGNILSITEMSSIVPRIISLTPFVQESDYWQYWREMTAQYNIGLPHPIPIEGDEDLINALVYASYQIPRLLNIAHRTWFNLRNNVITDREHIIRNFEMEATEYYKEMRSFLTDYPVSDISRIIMSCGVRWSVRDVNCDTVPGTNIPWSELIQRSVIFPYLDNCFLFPFTLVWRVSPFANDATSRLKKEIENHCHEEVKNFHPQDLFISYDQLCQCDIYHLGIRYEKLFASSLAVKYHVWKLANPSMENMVSFCQIYDFGGAESCQSSTLVSSLMTDLSEGIFYSETEICIQDDLPCAVIHNINNRNAHHDIILPTNQGGIPISAKASVSLAGKSVIDRQRLLSKNSVKSAKMLIWLYLGSRDTELKYTNVAFINGSGVCNGLSLDMLILVKKLKSLNNQQ